MGTDLPPENWISGRTGLFRTRHCHDVLNVGTNHAWAGMYSVGVSARDFMGHRAQSVVVRSCNEPTSRAGTVVISSKITSYGPGGAGAADGCRGSPGNWGSQADGVCAIAGTRGHDREMIGRVPASLTRAPFRSMPTALLKSVAKCDPIDSSSEVLLRSWNIAPEIRRIRRRRQHFQKSESGLRLLACGIHLCTMVSIHWIKKSRCHPTLRAPRNERLPKCRNVQTARRTSLTRTGRIVDRPQVKL